jgi:hypothetical protein
MEEEIIAMIAEGTEEAGAEIAEAEVEGIAETGDTDQTVQHFKSAN